MPSRIPYVRRHTDESTPLLHSRSIGGTIPVNDDISSVTPVAIPESDDTQKDCSVVVLCCALDDDDELGFGKGKGENVSTVQVDVGVGLVEECFDDLGRLRFWLVFGGICLNTFVATFDAILMASSHPVITSYFDASNSASWLSTSFLLTATAFQPLFGRVSDYIGRRQPNLMALFIFAMATIWCSLAPNVEHFIVARAFCGLGAGGVMVMGSIMINDLTPLETRGTYQAYLNIFFGLGSAGGAAFGGFLCEHVGWRWTFGMQVPFIFLTFAIGLLTVPERLGPCLALSSEKNSFELFKEFDVAGSLLLATSVACFILGINLGGNIYPWAHPLVLAALSVSIAAGSALVRVEAHAKHPVLPLDVLAKKPQSNVVWNNFFAAIGINIIMFNAPLYFNAVRLESASSSGLRLTFPSLAVTLAGCFSGLAITYTRRITWLLVSGTLLMLLGALCMSSMWHDIPPWLATLFIVPANMGQGLSFPAANLGVLVVGRSEEQASVTSLLTLGRSLGVVLGVAVSSGILENVLEGMLEGFVDGEDKAQVILRVRKSIKAIFDLPSETQAQVIRAFEESLRLTFISAIAVFLVALWLLVPVRLPRLGRTTLKELSSYGSME